MKQVITNPPDDPKFCPKCNADFQGEIIPEMHRQYYGNTTHFSRLIGISSMSEDRVIDWRCPDCGHVWKRK